MSAQPFQVRVIRSTRRKRSVGAQLVGNTITVTVPSWMSANETDKSVADMITHFERQRGTQRFDLPARARRLARQYDLPQVESIVWVSNMSARWGSCTASTSSIRLSDRMADFPDWVVDFVIVHELAHLVVPNHGPAFDALVARYPRSERAIGYLIAKSHAGDEPGEAMSGPVDG